MRKGVATDIVCNCDLKRKVAKAYFNHDQFVSQIAVGYSMRKFANISLRAILYSVFFENPCTYMMVKRKYINECTIRLVVL